MWRTLFVSQILLLLTFPTYCQWTYQKNTACYTVSGTQSVVCNSYGTIQSAATSREQFEQQWATGYAVGSLFRTIGDAWAAHHQRVESERGDLRSQIRKYQAGRADAVRELIRQDGELATTYEELSGLDLEHQDVYRAAIQTTNAYAAKFRESEDKMAQYDVVIANAKNLKYLREQCDAAEKTYETMYEYAQKGYVQTELTKGLLGYFRSDPEKLNAPPHVQAASDTRQVPVAEMDIPTLIDAAYKGDPAAQLRLGGLYEKGEGTLQDFVKAHAWYNLAASAGLAEATARRESLAARMTASDVAAAQKLAKEWKLGK